MISIVYCNKLSFQAAQNDFKDFLSKWQKEVYDGVCICFIFVTNSSLYHLKASHVNNHIKNCVGASVNGGFSLT